MQRRSFIKNSALFAVAVSTTGFINYNGKKYIGDCETTTDILGPYYRPDSPFRNNLIIKGDSGVLVELSGMVKHDDCTTPYKNAKIELWHCNSKGVYDNSSDEFLYRGTSFSNEQGLYSFQTILPVPYDAGGGQIRPAHFHLMITAPGYQTLVTQLYFSGDKYITKDQFASSSAAKRRILNVRNLNNGLKKVSFDISLSPSLKLEATALDKIIGSYTSDKNDKFELFKKNNLLWKKSEGQPFGVFYEYIGNNSFKYPGLYGMSRIMVFTFISDETIQVNEVYTNKNGEKTNSLATKRKS